MHAPHISSHRSRLAIPPSLGEFEQSPSGLYRPRTARFPYGRRIVVPSRISPLIQYAAITAGVGSATASFSGGVAAATLNGCTAGRHLIIYINWAQPYTASVTSVTISSESDATATPGGPSSQNASEGATPLDSSVDIYYLPNITASGNKTVTVTMNASVLGNIRVEEVQGGDTAAFYDSGGAAIGAASTPASVTFTTATANCAVAAALVGSKDSASWSNAAGYTVTPAATIYWYTGNARNLDVGAAGSKTVDIALGAAGVWTIKAAAFKAAGGGGGAANPKGPFGLPLNGPFGRVFS